MAQAWIQVSSSGSITEARGDDYIMVYEVNGKGRGGRGTQCTEGVTDLPVHGKIRNEKQFRVILICKLFSNIVNFWCFSGGKMCGVK